MSQLFIIRTKPNPTGKDQSSGNIPNRQLAAEWVDFRNDSGRALSLNYVVLQHVAYKAGYPNGVWELASDFSGNLGVNETVRVHSGAQVPLYELFEQDRHGVDHHVFTGKGYIWNNNQSDSPRLVVTSNGSQTEIDRATYSARPTEGKILIRTGDRLI